MTDELTPRQAAEELGVTVRTVQRWISSGRLPARRVGARVRVSRSSLAAVADTEPAARHPQPIRSLLIANRGEIATRIARTARRMGVRAIGVHADDERAPDGVDEAHRIRSYLDGEELLAVARRASADAVHPGYGFLAENAAFTDAVTQAGLAWVGPPAAAIRAMGDKAAARRQAAAGGVSTVPGYDGDAQDDASLRAAADRIGYPLLVKPSAGGGGKGMRVVADARQLPDALAAARRESARAFGDDRLVLERYLAGSRHVEVQVLFDQYGAGVHLGERDCSAQRRNQKIVEESPAPAVSAELRERMGSAALAAASAVGYANAGTVEMLLTDAGEFFFLEMNTRLQVEHPVTEAVTGRDLVEDQLRIAGGEPLAALGLDRPPTFRGHAIEARLYAEDPEAGFLPATGRVERLAWPDGVRIDTGIREGDEISDRYDPMLAKLIAHGATRDEALDRLTAALDATTVLGVRTNLRFLRWLLRQPPMRDEQMRTDTIGRMDLPEPPVLEEQHWQAAGRLAVAGGVAPWSDAWRLNASPSVHLRTSDAKRRVAVEPGAADGRVSAVSTGDVIHVDVDGQSIEVRTAAPPSVEEALRQASAQAGGGSASLTAPMPGRVIAVRVAQGGAVEARQPVIVIEAMKMEHAVAAPIDGVLVSLYVAEGQQVQRGDLLGEVAQSTP